MSIAFNFLKLFNPETAHNLGLQAMRWKLAAPGHRVGISRGNAASKVVLGNALKNPIGLAAGFDKNGYLPDVIERYGFGFMEVGSVTHLGGIGNPRPRMFRLPDGSIMNRMGLNGDPAIEVAQRLQKSISRCWGVNIAKTHSPDIMGDKAVLDICSTYQILKEHGALGFYTVLNLSCPNTADGRSFGEAGPLKDLLWALNPLRDHARPLLVKLSPVAHGSKSSLEELVKVCNDFNIKGYVCSNTVPHDHPEFGKGGLSGNSKLSHLLIRMIRSMHVRYGVDNHPDYPVIIACGGIGRGNNVIDYMDSGADLFQAYNGFVSGPNAGPRFAHNVIDEMEKYK